MQNTLVIQQIVDVASIIETHVDFFLALAACVYILLQFKEAKPNNIKAILNKIAQTYFQIKEAFIEVNAERKAHLARLEATAKDYNNIIGSIIYRSKYEQLVKEHNNLIAIINKKGGRQFLEHGSIQPQGIQINKDDLKILIQLCHPDKHSGKESAVEMTKKLLLLRQ